MLEDRSGCWPWGASEGPRLGLVPGSWARSHCWPPDQDGLRTAGSRPGPRGAQAGEVRWVSHLSVWLVLFCFFTQPSRPSSNDFSSSPADAKVRASLPPLCLGEFAHPVKAHLASWLHKQFLSAGVQGKYEGRSDPNIHFSALVPLESFWCLLGD